MNNIRPFIQKNNQELLSSVNERLTRDIWNKYCLGTLSKWEMDSVSFYSHPHELEKVDLNCYGCSNFFEMQENPEVDKVITIKGKQIPLFKIRRIAGTVLDKDKGKKTVTLLTKEGVVTVKIYGGIFSNYDNRSLNVVLTEKSTLFVKANLPAATKLLYAELETEIALEQKNIQERPITLLKPLSVLMMMEQ